MVRHFPANFQGGGGGVGVKGPVPASPPWEGVEVVDPPHPRPIPQWLLKALCPQTATARKAGAICWSAQVLEPGCAGDQLIFSSPAHSHMTIMWIFWRLIRCLIRRKEGENRGNRGKDASRGGEVWVWKPLRGVPLAPMPEATSVGSLPALHLLYDPRAVRFGTAHY